MGRPVAELLGGRPPVRVEVAGPGIRAMLYSGLVAVAVALAFPAKLAPLLATGWMVWLATQVRISASGGGAAPISARELSEWMAYYQLEPWGTMPEDVRAGIIASTIANANRDPKKQRKPFRPEDFMPGWSATREKPEQTPEEQQRILEMLQRMFEHKHAK